MIKWQEMDLPREGREESRLEGGLIDVSKLLSILRTFCV